MFWLIVQAQTAPVVFLAVCFGSLLCYKIHELWLSRITQLSWDFIVACTDSRWIRQLFATAIDVRNSNRNRSNSNQAHTYLLLNVESKTFSLQTKCRENMLIFWSLKWSERFWKSQIARRVYAAHTWTVSIVFCHVWMFCLSYPLLWSIVLAATPEPAEDPRVTRAKYFIRDEFLVSVSWLFHI